MRRSRRGRRSRRPSRAICICSVSIGSCAATRPMPRRTSGCSRARRPQLVWTDPPYGVVVRGQDGATGFGSTGTRLTDLAALLSGAFGGSIEALADGAALYVAHPAGPGARHLRRVLPGAGLVAAPDPGLGEGFVRARALAITTTSTSRSCTGSSPPRAGSGEAAAAGTAATPSRACSRWTARAHRAITQP